MAQHTEASEQEKAALEVGLDTLEDIGRALREIFAYVSDEALVPVGVFPPTGFTWQGPIYGPDGAYVRYHWVPGHCKGSGDGVGKFIFEIMRGDGTRIYLHELRINQVRLCV